MSGSTVALNELTELIETKLREVEAQKEEFEKAEREKADHEKVEREKAEREKAERDKAVEKPSAVVQSSDEDQVSPGNLQQFLQLRQFKQAFDKGKS